MRRLLVSVLLAGLLALSAAGSALAHVHGITPVDCVPANGNAGGTRTNDTPADDDSGGPISGFIPRDTGAAPIAPDAPPGDDDTPACEATD